MLADDVKIDTGKFRIAFRVDCLEDGFAICMRDSIEVSETVVDPKMVIHSVVRHFVGESAREKCALAVQSPAGIIALDEQPMLDQDRR